MSSGLSQMYILGVKGHPEYIMLTEVYSEDI